MRILLVDDHNLFLESLKNLLAAHGYPVVGVASDGFVALERARALRPDLVLMDITMPRCDGLVATRLIKAEMPQLRIVMLTASEEDEHLFEAIKSGACGYLLKSLGAPQFLEFIAQVERGEAPLSPGLAMRLLNEFARQAQPTSPPDPENNAALTARQIEILTLVARGLTYAQVGETLHLTERTVRYHMGAILARLHLDNRAQVIAYAAQRGYIPNTTADTPERD
ncbi:MAG TPA: response regulator transcription factor [Armatimonadota bacterium]|jgi:two-component system NarL family response regulator